jgi:tripartite-type tricarboxylate transporter receptor subunit TctC
MTNTKSRYWLKRFASCLVLASVALGAVSSAKAQTYPSKSIKLVVGYAAGGVADITARMLAQKLSTSMGQSVIVDNRAGAGGIVAADTVAKAEPDGYTLLLLNGGNAASVALFKSLPYDIVRDFSTICGIGYFNVVLLTNKASALNSVADLMAVATRNPDKFNIGTVSIGSTQHLSAELFKGMAGLPLTIVPFRATPMLVSAVMSNDIQVAFEVIAPVMSMIKSGDLKPLAVTSSTRFAGLPNVPTVMESGLPKYEVTAWNGIAAPAKTPRAIIDRLNKEINAALTQPDLKEMFQGLGMNVRGSTPEELHDKLVSEVAKWKDVVAAANIEKQ